MKHPVDAHVGRRMRQRRWVLGITQPKLSEMVGVKYQQIQKYETGANRVSASRLWDISLALNAPVSYFFSGLESGNKAGTEISDAGEGYLTADKEALEFVHQYYSIPAPHRKEFFELIKVLGDEE